MQFKSAQGMVTEARRYNSLTQLVQLQDTTGGAAFSLNHQYVYTAGANNGQIV